MATCSYVTKIDPSENIGDSLVKLNNNFFNLNFALCDLKDRLLNKVEIRTFFYYGVNSVGVNTPTWNMQDDITSRPSDDIIRDFVNNKLDLLSISKTNDQAYVIYQKTGYQRKEGVRVVSGTVTVTDPEKTSVLPWNTTTPDKYNNYSPAFIMWLLIHDGTNYKVKSGFPKFLQAETISTLNWNSPRTWATY